MGKKEAERSAAPGERTAAQGPSHQDTTVGAVPEVQVKTVKEEYLERFKNLEKNHPCQLPVKPIWENVIKKPLENGTIHAFYVKQCDRVGETPLLEYRLEEVNDFLGHLRRVEDRIRLTSARMRQLCRAN